MPLLQITVIFPEFIRFNGPFDSAKNMQIVNNLEFLKKLRHQADYYIKKDDCLHYGHVWVEGSVEDALAIAKTISDSFQKMN